MSRLVRLLLLLACLGAWSGNAPAAVTWQAAGTAVSGTTAAGVGANPAWPAHAANDIALLFVESTGGQPVTLSVPNGFVAVPNSPQATGSGTAGTQLTVFWARATSTAMAAPIIASPSDHFYARIITFRGVINNGNPWDVTGGGVKAVASTSVTVTGVTTTVANTLVVQAVARDNDNAAAAFSAETNANLTGIAERLDAGTANGNGGGLGIWSGIKATAGATGNTTATVTSSINAFLTIALKPQPGPRFQAAGAAVGGTATASPVWPAHAVDDIALLFVESTGGQPATLSIPAGFVAVANSPQATGAGLLGTQLTIFWARATSAAMTAPTIADPGDHVYAQIITYRGVANVGDPWDVTGGGVKTPASTAVTVSGVTTTVADTLIVQAVARDNDNAAAAFSAQTNASLTGIAERSDAGTTQGNGGGFTVWDGYKATAGATGNTTATVTSSINAFLTIALKPQASYAPVFGVAGTAIATGLNWPTHAIDDVALLFIESAGGQIPTLTDAAGFVEVPNSPQATGAGTAGTRLTVFWARATSAAMVGPTITGPADHAYAQIITYRGTINTGNPWDVIGGGVKTPASTSVAVAGVTTTVLNTRIVQAVARDNDNAAAAFSAETNANLTGIAERSDLGTTTGLGGGFAVWDGAKATAAATGNTTATVTSSINAFLTIALKPPAVAGPDHIQISHDGNALTCSPETVTITACANAACTAPHYAAGANVTLTPGGQVFAIDATGINSAATVQQSTASTATLSAVSVPAATSATPTTCWNTATSTASCAMAFSDSGFVVTVPNHTSCNSATATIDAVQTAPGTGRCVPAYQNVTRAVKLYSTYVSPATGAQVVTASTGAVSTTAPGTAHNLAFNGTGTATITLSYPDAGQLTLTVGDTAPTGKVMTGSSTFVVAPASFAFSAIPAAPLTAGQAFNATVTAMRPACTMPVAPAAATPNFNGTVTITSSNPQPGIGNATAINTPLSGFSNGAASTNLTWNEVGTIDLNASLVNYLGSALSINGTQSGTGRFQPAYFNTVVTQGCGTFTYAGTTAPVKTGQPFTVTVTANKAGGGTTANYAGAANAYPTTLSNAGVTAGFASNTIVAASFANGVGSANVTYEFATPQTAPLTLTMRATNADPTPVSSFGHTEGTTDIRSGRAKLVNAHGSELLALPIPFRAEYWNNGWVLNSADSCSGDVSLGAGNAVSVTLVTLPPAVWVTCIQDSGILTGLSGTGCAAAGPVAQRFKKGATPSIGFAGDFNLWLRAPGAGNTGAVTVTGNVPVWLQYPWGGGVAINPTARATFGVYKGSNEFIYLRENY